MHRRRMTSFPVGKYVMVARLRYCSWYYGKAAMGRCDYDSDINVLPAAPDLEEIIEGMHSCWNNENLCHMVTFAYRQKKTLLDLQTKRLRSNPNALAHPS